MITGTISINGFYDLHHVGSILDRSYDGNRSDAFCDHKTEYVAAVDHDGSGDEELPFFGDCTDRSLDPLCGGGDTVRWFPDRNF